MRVQAEVSLYPLRTDRIGEPIEQLLEILMEHQIKVSVGSMSTRLEGEDEEVFAALHKAFSLVAEGHQIVVLIKLSNACPSGVE